MSTSSNVTKAFVQCCHGKHKVASSRTLLSEHVILKWVFKKEGEKDMIDTAQDRDKCRAVVHTVMNIRVSQKAGNFFTS